MKKNIFHITPEMDRFYYSSDEALINFVSLMNIKILIYKMSNELLESKKKFPYKKEQVSSATTDYFYKKINER